MTNQLLKYLSGFRLQMFSEEDTDEKHFSERFTILRE